MFRIYSRFDVGDFCTWNECKGCRPKFDAGEREAARDWLRGFLVDDAHVAVLRQLAHRAGADRGLPLHTTQAVVDQLAHLVASGELRVCGRDHPSHLIETSVGTAPPGPPPPPVAPRTRSAPVAAPSEPATLPGNVDASAMAATLVAAAEAGVPFCEVCEKNKKAPQPTGAAA